MTAVSQGMNPAVMEEAHAYRGPRAITPEDEEVLSKAVTSKPIATASVDRQFVNADVSTDAEVD